MSKFLLQQAIKNLCLVVYICLNGSIQKKYIDTSLKVKNENDQT